MNEPYGPDDWFPQPLGTGHATALSDEKTKPRAPRFTFGFAPPNASMRNAAVRTRHRGSVSSSR